MADSYEKLWQGGTKFVRLQDCPCLPISRYHFIAFYLCGCSSLFFKEAYFSFSYILLVKVGKFFIELKILFPGGKDFPYLMKKCSILIFFYLYLISFSSSLYPLTPHPPAHPSPLFFSPLIFLESIFLQAKHNLKAEVDVIAKCLIFSYTILCLLFLYDVLMRDGVHYIRVLLDIFQGRPELQKLYSLSQRFIM